MIALARLIGDGNVSHLCRFAGPPGRWASVCNVLGELEHDQSGDMVTVPYRWGPRHRREARPVEWSFIGWDATTQTGRVCRRCLDRMADEHRALLAHLAAIGQAWPG